MAVTIKDVALQAGVSISTVSKVIHNSTRISESTRARVQAVMEELNFFPNSIAASFVQQSTFTIGVLMELREGMAFVNPYIYEILGGIEALCHEKGFHVTILNLYHMKDVKQALLRLILEKRIDGLLLHQSPLLKTLSPELKNHNFPFMVIGQPENQEVAYSWIDINNRLGGQIAAQELLSKGYKKLGFIGGLASEGISKQRQEGFEGFLKASGEFFDPGLIKNNAGSDKAAGRKLTEELFHEGGNFDALVCSSNFLALGALEVIKEKGLRIPEDKGLFTFDNFPLAEYTYPPLSVVDIRLFDLGYRAAGHLIEKIQNPELSVQAQFLNFQVILRDSSRGPERS